MPNPFETYPTFGHCDHSYCTVLLWSPAAGCYVDSLGRGWVIPELIFLRPGPFHVCLHAPPGGLSKLQRIGVG